MGVEISTKRVFLNKVLPNIDLIDREINCHGGRAGRSKGSAGNRDINRCRGSFYGPGAKTPVNFSVSSLL